MNYRDKSGTSIVYNEPYKAFEHLTTLAKLTARGEPYTHVYTLDHRVLDTQVVTRDHP